MINTIFASIDILRRLGIALTAFSVLLIVAACNEAVREGQSRFDVVYRTRAISLKPVSEYDGVVHARLAAPAFDHPRFVLEVVLLEIVSGKDGNGDTALELNATLRFAVESAVRMFPTIENEGYFPRDIYMGVRYPSESRPWWKLKAYGDRSQWLNEDEVREYEPLPTEWFDMESLKRRAQKIKEAGDREVDALPIEDDSSD